MIYIYYAVGVCTINNWAEGSCPIFCWSQIKFSTSRCSKSLDSVLEWNINYLAESAGMPVCGCIRQLNFVAEQWKTRLQFRRFRFPSKDVFWERTISPTVPLGGGRERCKRIFSTVNSPPWGITQVGDCFLRLLFLDHQKVLVYY